MGAAADLGWPLVADTDLVRNLPAELTALADAIGNVFQGAWTAFVPQLVRADTGAVLASTGAGGQYKRFGKTVIAQGFATASAATPAGAGQAITLPFTAKQRVIECGALHVWGNTVPADQSGVASMAASLDRLNVVAFTGGFRDVAAGATLRYHCVYEVA